MRSHETSVVKAVTKALVVIGFLGLAASIAEAQSAQYKRPKAKASSSKEGAADKDKGAAGKKSDKLDISDLENKYWAPKDTDFSVVQNRTYSKKGRYSVTAMAGILVNDPYSTGTNLGITGSYFWSEREGVEVSYTTMDPVNSKLTDEFRNVPGSGILPDHGKVTSAFSAGYTWVPVYAKMSLLGKKIVYFDMAFTPNLGIVTYDQQVDAIGGGNKSASAVSLGLDMTQYFFFNEHWALRLDIRNRWFQEDVLGYSNVNRGKVVKTNTNNTTQFLFGGTFFF